MEYFKQINQKFITTLNSPEASLLYRIIVTLFFKEIVFATLPLIIAFFVAIVLGKPLMPLLYSPEWSFATIVLIASAMSHTIDLKTKYQKDFSYSIHILNRIGQLILIASVLCLSFFYLQLENQPKVIKILFLDITTEKLHINSNFLVITQIFSLFVTIYILILSSYHKQKHIQKNNECHYSQGKNYWNNFVSCLKCRLIELEDSGRNVEDIIIKKDKLKILCDKDKEQLNKNECEDFKIYIECRFNEIERIINRAKNGIKNLEITGCDTSPISKNEVQ